MRRYLAVQQTVPPPGPANYFNLAARRARMEGFIVTDYDSLDLARRSLPSPNGNGTAG